MGASGIGRAFRLRVASPQTTPKTVKLFESLAKNNSTFEPEAGGESKLTHLNLIPALPHI